MIIDVKRNTVDCKTQRSNIFLREKCVNHNLRYSNGRYLLAHWLSCLEEAFSPEVALAWVARFAGPAATLSVSDPRVPVAVWARALERAEHVRAFAQWMAVVQFRTVTLVKICTRIT